MVARRGKCPKNIFFTFLVFFHIDTIYIKLDWNSDNFLTFWCTLVRTHLKQCASFIIAIACVTCTFHQRQTIVNVFFVNITICSLVVVIAVFVFVNVYFINNFFTMFKSSWFLFQCLIFKSFLFKFSFSVFSLSMLSLSMFSF